jgi:hypothetical protein
MVKEHAGQRTQCGVRACMPPCIVSFHFKPNVSVITHHITSHPSVHAALPGLRERRCTHDDCLADNVLLACSSGTPYTPDRDNSSLVCDFGRSVRDGWNHHHRVSRSSPSPCGCSRLTDIQGSEIQIEMSVTITGLKNAWSETTAGVNSTFCWLNKEGIVRHTPTCSSKLKALEVFRNGIIKNTCLIQLVFFHFYLPLFNIPVCCQPNPKQSVKRKCPQAYRNHEQRGWMEPYWLVCCGPLKDEWAFLMGLFCFRPLKISSHVLPTFRIIRHINFPKVERGKVSPI